MAVLKVDGRVRETSTTVGAGDLNLAGAPAGFQSFSSLGYGNYTTAFITDDVDFESGIYTIAAAPDRLQAVKIFNSSNADAKVAWGNTTKKVRCGLPAALAFPLFKTKDVSGAAGTTVLTADEQRVHILELTGALTGNRVIEVDATPWKWIVYNNTTGAFTLTVRVTGQTGVAVPQGKRAVLHCNQTDVRYAAPYVSGTTGDPEFASGTALVFNQTAAPTGWTKQTTHNDKALRVVSGTVGSGGATAFTSVFGSGKSTGGFSLTTNEMANHSHTTIFTTAGAGGTFSYNGNASTTPLNPVNANGSGAAHSHTLSLDLQYVDVIIATKN